ncbi:MAG: PKD domain-containing protein, partial [Anaerolineae bacterium]|nr:PKD domain-containing protein [Anaerolineae bacterium]
VFVGTFDGWYNDPNQALYLTMLYDDVAVDTLKLVDTYDETNGLRAMAYDDVAVDTLKLVDTYDETNGLRAMAYDPTHRRLYLAVGSTMMVVEVNHGETCPAPLTGVEIAGTALGQIDTPYTFLAVTTPANATSPVSYTWSPEPLSGQGTAVVTYSWASPGDYAVALTASNCGGVDTATHNVKILAAAPERVCLPVIVR